MLTDLTLKETLNYKCFINQFPHEVDISQVEGILRPERHDLAQEYGVKIFRCLNKVIIKHDGKFWRS